MRKLIALILSFLLTFSLVFPGFAEDTEYPTIYVTGAQTNWIYSADGEVLYPISDDVDTMEVIKEALMPCLEKLAYGLVTDDYEAYAKEFYDAFVPIFEGMALDKNGEASDGSHSEYTIYNFEIPKKSSNYGILEYEFWYDWRLSPIAAAEELKIFIDMVKEATGESKVNILGRCYGANVIQSYLVKHEEHALANVDDVAYLTSSILGIDMLSALFSGELELNDKAVNDFLNYYVEQENLIEDDATALLVMSLVELFRQVKVLGVTGDMLKSLVDKIKYDLIPPIIRDTYGSMPSYWSMVTPELYEKAIDFIYGGVEDEYKNLIAKTDDYYQNVQLTAAQDMLTLKEKGIDFQLFVKYDYPDIPIYANATNQSDGFTSCVRQAFGGEYADYGTVFSEKYLEENKDSKYISPDFKINAETCLFPENTWFIKGIYHTTFPERYSAQAFAIMNGEHTVSDGVYSQFQYDDGALHPTTEPDEDYAATPDSPFASLIKFLTALLNFMKGLFSGEIKLPF